MEYNRDLTGDVSYYDQDSVKRTTSGIVRVWTTKIFSENSETKRKIQNIFIRLSRDGGEKIHSSKLFWEIYCSKDMWRLMSYTYYDVNGLVLYLPSVPSDWDYIIPNSDMDKLGKIVCK